MSAGWRCGTSVVQPRVRLREPRGTTTGRPGAVATLLYPASGVGGCGSGDGCASPPTCPLGRFRSASNTLISANPVTAGLLQLNTRWERPAGVDEAAATAAAVGSA